MHARSSALPGAPDVSAFGFLLAIIAILLLTISPLALVSLGLNYDEPGGNPLEKIHPATLASAIAVLLAAIASGNPVSYAITQASRHPVVVLYLGAIGLLILHSIRVVNLPFTHFFDTFVLPAFVFLLYKDMSGTRARRLAFLIHGLMFANAALGIVEFATGLRLTPLVAAGVTIEDDWRSTALLGHPLSNASLTGSYLLLLALGGARGLPFSLRSAAFVTNAAAMIVFGGRAATVLLVAIFAVLGLLRLVTILRGGRFQTTNVLKVLAALPVAALGTAVLAEYGFFDLFINRFVDDKGSADTRTEMFELFAHIPWSELLLAPDAQLMETLRFRYGLEFGIESFWISFVLAYGLIAGVAFFAALLAFSYEVMRSVRSGAVWAFAFFYAVASTSVSLSAKSPLLAIFTFMVLVLMHRTSAPGPGPVDDRSGLAAESDRMRFARPQIVPPAAA